MSHDLHVRLTIVHVPIVASAIGVFTTVIRVLIACESDAKIEAITSPQTNPV